MWLVLALLTAVFTSTQDILNKKALIRVNPYIVTWGWWCFSLPFLYIYLIFDGVPVLDQTFWYSLGISTILLVIGAICYVKALQHADLSLSIPMLSFSPILLLFTSSIMLREYPTPLGIVGVVLIVSGAYTLFLKDRSKGIFAPFKSLLIHKGPRYMLAVVLLFSISGNIDKIGVVHSSPLMWILSLNTTAAFFLFFIMLKKSNNTAVQIKLNWGILLAIGFFNALALISQMNAIQLTLVPYLIAVKRTSVIISALYGFIILKEKGFQERMPGILLMIFGVFLVAYS